MGFKKGLSLSEAPPIYNICHIEADSLLHKMANIVEEKYIEVSFKSSGKTKEFKNVTTFYGRGAKKDGGWLAKFNKAREVKGKSTYTVDDFNIISKSRVLPLKVVDENTEETVGFSSDKEAIDFAVKQFNFKLSNIRKKMLSKDYKLYIGGVGNFRKKIATITPYKGSRPERPILFKAIEEKIKSIYKDRIVVCDGQESEDVISIAMMNNYDKYLSTGVWEDCFSYIDKDLEMIVSPRINYDKLSEGFFIPTFQESQECFLRQLLTGDSTDDIVGLPSLSKSFREERGISNTRNNSVGASTAKHLIDGVDTLKDKFEEVCRAYEDHYGDDWEEYLSENAILLWMRTKENQIWDINFYKEVITEYGGA